MLDVLRRRLPDTRTSVAGAEDLPVPDRSVDVVVAAQCFHWFDHDLALPEIARVLKPGGHIALVWNVRDERIPWVRKLGRIIGSQEQDSDDVAAGSRPVRAVRLRRGRDVQALAGRQPRVDPGPRRCPAPTSRPSTTRPAEAKLAEVLAFYDDYGRGMDGMQLPYDTLCFRAVVTDRQDAEPDDEADADESDATSPNDGTDTEMLLIDFR